MTIEVTEQAAKHISGMLLERGCGLGMRLSTKASGCTGYAYVVDYADTLAEDDIKIEAHGATVFVDKNSLTLIDGMVLDYVKTNGLNHGFEFRNPNVKAECGCGESFTV
ncbi:MAG: iron-sulfur cluster assembly accessory protein [Gammaproteobacteria bacterium]|jgi:iron-sulfur cluster assembly protein